MAFLSLIVLWGDCLSLGMSILASLIHEIGHVIMMMITDKSRIRKVNIGFFNVDIIDKSRSDSPVWKDIVVLLGGFLMNFLISVLSMGFYFVFKSEYFKIFSYVNIFIGILNLLPISVLDGGQIFFLVLGKNFNAAKSFWISQSVSILFLIPLSIFGFIILLNSKYNFSLLILSCYLMIYVIFKEDMCF